MILRPKSSRLYLSVVMVAGLVALGALGACKAVAPRQHGALSNLVETVLAAIDVRVRASVARDATPGVALALRTSDGLVGVRT